MTYLTIVQDRHGNRSARIDLAAMRADGAQMAPAIARLPRDVVETHWPHACEERPGVWVMDDDSGTTFASSTEADEFMLTMTRNELGLI